VSECRGPSCRAWRVMHCDKSSLAARERQALGVETKRARLRRNEDSRAAQGFAGRSTHFLHSTPTFLHRYTLGRVLGPRGAGRLEPHTCSRHQLHTHHQEHHRRLLTASSPPARREWHSLAGKTPNCSITPSSDRAPEPTDV
jgi:hypothetical protein